MKQFNKEITVKVQVDTIANKLLESILETNPHREMITETIIGSMLESDNISLLYNNLNGWTNDLDFKMGQEVYAEQTFWTYVEQSTAEVIPSSTFKEISTPIGNCTIKNINIFRNQGDYVEVEYTYTNSQGKVSTRTSWLAPSQLKAIEQPETTE